jgi:hypothetical protein
MSMAPSTEPHRVADDDAILHDDGQLRANAWCGSPVTAARDASFDAWGTAGKREAPKKLLAPAEVDPGNWRDPTIGWGVVLADSSAPAPDKARALDAPECVRTLIAARSNAPVFRYVSTLPPGVLRRYAPDGSHSDPGVAGLRGMGANAMPKFLLIIGSPAEIPWSVQYRLQLDAAVGRLDLDAAGLEHYIDALLSDFNGAKVARTTPVVWAVDHGPQDITRLMRRTIADRLAKAFATDACQEFVMQGGTLADDTSTGPALVDALVQRTPAFIATSSHGATGPLDDAAAMKAQLGVPVDRDHTTLALGALTATWSPHGAVWYAHACCSAGCDAVSAFAGVAPATSTLGQTLTALGALGAQSAPLPKLLLGRPSPARAFIGHVEPTFDWTLRDTRNGQTTTAHIIDAFYGQLHRASKPPLGLAMQTYYRAVGGLWRDVANARDDMNAFKAGATDEVRRLRLIASDLESMVLLGDPTVTIG